MPVKNREIIFASRPSPKVGPDNFKIQDTKYPDEGSMKDGDVLIRLVYTSVDPYMRGRMNEGKSYVEPWKLGGNPEGGVIVRVVKSKNNKFREGDMLQGYLPWKMFQIVDSKTVSEFTVIPKDFYDKASLFLGVCGMPGLTALLSIKNIAQPKQGETVFISGAAGAVGSTAGQIFKLKGLKVFGVAGSDEKVKFLKELGFDEAFNYHSKEYETALKKFAPDGVNIYFDNVGGPMLETALEHMGNFGRIVSCGAISTYQQEKEGQGVRNIFYVTSKRLKMQGLIVFDWKDQFEEGTKQLMSWVKEGKLKPRETVIDGFDNIPKAFVGLFSGDNIGKMVVRCDDDDNQSVSFEK